MAGFKTFLQKGYQNTSRFFNTTLPTSVRQGVKFFNSTVLPTAKKVHNVHQAVTKELKENPHVHEKVCKQAEKSSAFADLGLTKLNQAAEATNRVAGQLGLG